MTGLGRALCGVGIAALLGSPALAQDDSGGLRLTFGLAERLELSENAGLSTPSTGRLTSSVTQLSFGLSSETRTQALQLSLTGNLRFEDGASAASADGLADPALALTYSRSGANSNLVLQANADRTLLARAAPTAEDPDPNGEGTRLRHSVAATLDLGVQGPLGLTLTARSSGADYTDSPEADTESRGLSATGHLRLASGATAEVMAAQTITTEDDALSQRSETTDLSLGWTQPLSSSLTLQANLGQQRVDSLVLGSLADRTEGVSAKAALAAELANGSAGLVLSQSQEPGAVRQTLQLQRRLDLGTQALSLSLGATRQDQDDPATIGSLDWRMETGQTSLSLAIERSVASGGLGSEVMTDRLALGLTRALGPTDRVSLNLSGARIDDTSAPLVNRVDLSATYSRDFGEGWQFNIGAAMTERSEAGAADVRSNTVFLSVSKTFEFRP